MSRKTELGSVEKLAKTPVTSLELWASMQLRYLVLCGQRVVFAPVPRSRKPGRSVRMNEKRYRAGLVGGAVFQQALVELDVTFRRSAVKLEGNGGRASHTAPPVPMNRHWIAARRPKPCQLAFNPALCKTALPGKLTNQWSPQQIAGWLRPQFPETLQLNISHETNLQKACSFKRVASLKRSCCTSAQAVGSLPSGAHIKQQPGRRRGQIIDAVRSATDRRRLKIAGPPSPGTGRGDLMSVQKNHPHATLVERSSRFVITGEAQRKTKRQRCGCSDPASASPAARAEGLH